MFLLFIVDIILSRLWKCRGFFQIGRKGSHGLAGIAVGRTCIELPRGYKYPTLPGVQDGGTMPPMSHSSLWRQGTSSSQSTEQADPLPKERPGSFQVGEVGWLPSWEAGAQHLQGQVCLPSQVAPLVLRRWIYKSRIGTPVKKSAGKTPSHSGFLEMVTGHESPSKHLQQHPRQLDGKQRRDQEQAGGGVFH